MSDKLREALESIVNRFEKEDQGGLTARPGLTWAMYTDAKGALAGAASVGADEAAIRLNEQKHHGGHMRDCPIFGDDGCDCGYKARIAELERALGATSKEGVDGQS